jgi:GNAT superfamily N-acetyltransferase
MDFQRERVTREAIAEAMPLLVAHWQEIAHYQDIPLDPDIDAYLRMEKQGLVRAFAARRDGRLIGYAIYFVKHNPHYQASLQASQDILYLDPDHRGQGLRFVRWCDEQLAAEGVQAVYHHVKASHNFGPALARMGYELVDLIYARRLDR